MMMCFGGFIFRDVFRWLWCTVYMRHHLYLVSSIPYILWGWRLIIFADSKHFVMQMSIELHEEHRVTLLEQIHLIHSYAKSIAYL